MHWLSLFEIILNHLKSSQIAEIATNGRSMASNESHSFTGLCAICGSLLRVSCKTDTALAELHDDTDRLTRFEIRGKEFMAQEFCGKNCERCLL